MENFALSGSLVLALAILVLAVILVWRGVIVVPQGYEWTVERFGRYTRTLKPGLTFIVPFIDTIGRKLSVMEIELELDKREIISADNVLVSADAVIYYRVDNVAKAAYEVQNLQSALVNLAITNLRSVLGSMELDAMLSNREKINKQLQESIDEATSTWGVKVTRVEISELQLSDELQNAMNLQMTAERRRRATVTEANGFKEAEVLKAEGEREGNILRAEGEKEAAFMAAEAREREAEAEAAATRMVSEAIENGNVRALQFFIAQEYTAAMKEIGSASNSKVIMMPVEATGLTSSVAGLAELLSDIKGS